MSQRNAHDMITRVCTPAHQKKKSSGEQYFTGTSSHLSVCDVELVNFFHLVAVLFVVPVQRKGSHGALARNLWCRPIATWLPLQASLLGAWVFSFKLDLQWGSSSLLQYLYGLTEARPQREYSGVRSQTRIGKKNEAWPLGTFSGRTCVCSHNMGKSQVCFEICTNEHLHIDFISNPGYVLSPPRGHRSYLITVRLQSCARQSAQSRNGAKWMKRRIGCFPSQQILTFRETQHLQQGLAAMLSCACRTFQKRKSTSRGSRVRHHPVHIIVLCEPFFKGLRPKLADGGPLRAASSCQ